MEKRITESIAGMVAAAHRPASATSFLESIMNTASHEMPNRVLPNTVQGSTQSTVRRTGGDNASYSSVRSTLTTRICDAAYNDTYLMDKPWTPCGPFAVVYRVRLGEEAAEGTSPVTNDLMRAWGVSIEQLHTDALEAERKPLALHPMHKAAHPFFGMCGHHEQDPTRS